MKVSLSASHGDCPLAIALLDTCDLIYTTQWERIKELQDLFPRADIRPVPDGTPAMQQFLEDRHVEDEVVSFGDLMALRNQWRRSQSKERSPGLLRLVPRKLDWYIACRSCPREAMVCENKPGMTQEEVKKELARQATWPNFEASGWFKIGALWYCPSCVSTAKVSAPTEAAKEDAV